jgi:hypothetical protein
MGAWVLHMLRRMIGEQAFFEFLLDYRAAHEGGSVSTDDFRTALSASFGEDFGWYVDQWVTNPGSPDYEWNWTSLSVAKGHYLKLAIRPTQDLDGFPVFTMPISVRVTTPVGTQVLTVWNDDWDETYVLPVDAQPLFVAFDEDDGAAGRNWVLSDTRAQVSFPVISPPMLVSAVVSPSQAGGDTIIELAFSEQIANFDTADLVLTGASSGVRTPDSVSYDVSARTATVTYSGLPGDDYVLTILAADVIANGMPLDGEVDDAKWWDTQLLPSGNGQAGGDATVAFNLPAQVPTAAPPAISLLSLLLLSLGRLATLRRARA